MLELSIRYTKLQRGEPRVTATWPTDVRNRLPINEITRNQTKDEGLGKGPRCHLECGWALNQSQAMLPDCSWSFFSFCSVSLLVGSTVQHLMDTSLRICISAAWKFSYCTRNLCQRGRHFIVCPCCWVCVKINQRHFMLSATCGKMLGIRFVLAHFCNELKSDRYTHEKPKNRSPCHLFINTTKSPLRQKLKCN